MLRQIAGYGPASLIPALLSFVMVYVFTRLLPRAEYGEYTLAWNAVMLGQTVFYYALAHGASRLYPSAHKSGTTWNLLKSGYFILGIMVGVGAVLTGLSVFVSSDVTVWLVIPLLTLKGTINLNQDFNRIAGHMARFTLVVATDALIGFATALLLVRLMPTASSLLLGLCVGSVCATMLDGPRMVSALRRGHIQRPILREITRIGAPLSLTFLLSASIMYADRFIVGGFISTKELATYAVAWSLVSQPITLVGSALAIATMPMAMHALDLHGYQAGRTQAGRTGMLIIALIAPAAAGLAMCHEQVATLLTGAEFRATVSTLIPFVAGISFLRAVGSFYLEHAYYLSRRSDLMLYAYIPPAVANIVLNLIAAPIFGIAGVLVTAAICQVMTAAGLVYFARGVFPLLFPWRPLVSVAAASIAMMIAVYMLHADVSWFGLAQQVIVGAAVYGIILFATDAFEVRTRCSEMIRGRRFFSSANPGE